MELSEERYMRKKASYHKGINLAAIFIPIIGGAAALFGGTKLIILFDDSEGFSLLIAGILLLLISVAAIIIGSIFFYIMIYRAWLAIQDMKKGKPRTTPGAAVGYLFIPFFNIYWFFVAIYGLALDYNKYIEQHRYNLPKMTAGLYLTCLIYPIMFFIPRMGPILFYVWVLLMFFVWAEIGLRLNALVKLKNNGK
jgi:hypothetical protein